eukprot:TRINITY_DN53395_c0_g1_i1.p1 TRINITY_DN53395_c0_g1~~TRINITY_DN53395_c0_g1_i1.p1  ORF type:complete len:219 (+),score=52.96 TRINITY_DN53395_c0_g1_i1:37-693(+)
MWPQTGAYGGYGLSQGGGYTAGMAQQGFAQQPMGFQSGVQSFGAATPQFQAQGGFSQQVQLQQQQPYVPPSPQQQAIPIQFNSAGQPSLAAQSTPIPQQQQQQAAPPASASAFSYLSDFKMAAPQHTWSAPTPPPAQAKAEAPAQPAATSNNDDGFTQKQVQDLELAKLQAELASFKSKIGDIDAQRAAEVASLEQLQASLKRLEDMKGSLEHKQGTL